MTHANPSDAKVSVKCGLSKPWTEFGYSGQLARPAEACKACTARYRAAHLRWRTKDRKSWNERSEKWRTANPERYRAAELGRTKRLKAAAFAAYGGCCACCGKSDGTFLTIDHVANDGSTHRKTVGSETKFYRWLALQGYPASFQVLCMKCNFGKARNGGICPHQELREAATRHRRRRDQAQREEAPKRLSGTPANMRQQGW
jgi:hypothetical protein